ncbi:MAG: endo-1,4-beta-xylanase [Ancalomicrobiaceae bacterium]|nr:endo-1,4-beta-xylanase [Ancalomicrobiaceae bacterium]
MMPMTRRNLVSGLAAGMLGLSGWPAVEAASPQCRAIAPAPKQAAPVIEPPLGDLGRQKGVAIGVQLDVSYTHDYGEGMYDAAYTQLVRAEKPDFVAFGSAFKFGNVAADAPSSDGLLAFSDTPSGVADTWYVARDLAAMTRAAGIGGRADALVWQDDQVIQPWLRKIAAGSAPDRRKNADLDWNLTRMEAYIAAAIAKMYDLSAGDPAYFRSISLVNEPLDPFAAHGRVAYRGGSFAPPGLFLDTETKPAGYIADAFRTAEAVNRAIARERGTSPLTAQLILNETTLETDQFGPVMRPALLKLLRQMQAEGLAIGGVGLECHLQPQMMADPFKPDWSAFGTFLDEVAGLGLDIHLTELDVIDYVTSCSGHKGSIEDSDRLVAHYFESFLARALACPKLKSITFWDLSDRYSFYRQLDVASWYGYDHVRLPQALRSWPRCGEIPAKAEAIACPRPAVYDDHFRPKPARAAIARALVAAPPRG